MLNEEQLKEHHKKMDELLAKAGEGPWTGEPHREEFKHQGLDCLLERGPFGAWCGYAAVPKGHPLFGKAYGLVDDRIEVHGGLTYSNGCQGVICHKTDDPEDQVWWLGFDCSHAFDLDLYRKVNFPQHITTSYEVYRDISYVRNEVKRLASQLAAIKEVA